MFYYNVAKKIFLGVVDKNLFNNIIKITIEKAPLFKNLVFSVRLSSF